MRAVEDNRIRADPHIVLHHDSSFGGRETLMADWDVSTAIGMVRWHDATPRCDQDVVPEADPVAGIEDSMGIEIAVFTDHDVAAAADRLDNHVVVDLCVSTNTDPGALDRWSDNGRLRYLSGGVDR